MTVAFGLSFVATKYALRGFQPLLVALLRFTVAGAALWLLWRRRAHRERPSPAELRRLALIGFVSLTVYFTFENLGIARTSASAASILIATIPIFVAVLNVVTLREHTTARQWAGALLSFAGIVILVGLAGGVGVGVRGDLLVLAASLSAAVYSLLARRLLLSRSALYVTTFQTSSARCSWRLWRWSRRYLRDVRAPTPQAIGAVLYLALACSMLANLLLNYAFRFLPANRVAVFINLTPLVGVGGAYVLLGERFTAGQAVAAAIVVGGVWLANSVARAGGGSRGRERRR